jgi:putative DNA primase/helicase
MGAKMNSEYQKPTIDYSDPMPDPILFDECVLPEIKADYLPNELSEFAKALALEAEVSESMTVMAILGVLSVVLAKHFVVSPKSGWLEPVNLYMLIALPPGNNKSLVLKRCRKPLEQWEESQQKTLSFEISKRLSEIDTEKAIISKLRFDAARETNPIKQMELKQKIAEQEASMPKPIVPPCLFATDITPESLAEKACEQNGRFGVLSDEGGIIETLSGLYTNGRANLDIVLKGIDGGAVRVNRKNGDYLSLKPHLSFLLCVQPKVIEIMAQRPIFEGKGFLERFLYILPKSKLGYRTHSTESIPDHIESSYYEKIMSLLEIHRHRTEDNSEEPITLSLSDEALALWKSFQAKIEIDLRPDGKLALCQGWAGKICGYALRIAGLLHVAENGLSSSVISYKAVFNTIEIAKCLLEHAICAFELMSSEPEITDAREFLESIIRAYAREGQPFTRTQLNRLVKQRSMGKKERLDKAISVLLERHILFEHRDSSTRKPTTWYRLNPKLLSGLEYSDN